MGQLYITNIQLIEVEQISLFHFKLEKLEFPVQIHAKSFSMLDMSRSSPPQSKTKATLRILSRLKFWTWTRHASRAFPQTRSDSRVAPGPFDPPEAPSAKARPKRAPRTECHKWPWQRRTMIFLDVLEVVSKWCPNSVDRHDFSRTLHWRVSWNQKLNLKPLSPHLLACRLLQVI